MNTQFLIEQFFVNVRAYFPTCTFTEFNAPDYAPHIYGVYQNGELLFWSAWYDEWLPDVDISFQTYKSYQNVPWNKFNDCLKKFKYAKHV